MGKTVRHETLWTRHERQTVKTYLVKLRASDLTDAAKRRYLADADPDGRDASEPAIGDGHHATDAAELY